MDTTMEWLEPYAEGRTISYPPDGTPSGTYDLVISQLQRMDDSVIKEVYDLVSPGRFAYFEAHGRVENLRSKVEAAGFQVLCQPKPMTQPQRLLNLFGFGTCNLLAVKTRLQHHRPLRYFKLSID